MTVLHSLICQGKNKATGRVLSCCSTRGQHLLVCLYKHMAEQAGLLAHCVTLCVFLPWTVVSGSLNRTLRSPFRLWLGSVSDHWMGLGLFRMEMGTLLLVTYIRKFRLNLLEAA